MMRKFYGSGLPQVDPAEMQGRLIVIEGADGSGRTTQAEMLSDWLERRGSAVVNVELPRSTLVSNELQKAKEGNILNHTTMSLFYATDLADQIENTIVPALRAGFIVLCDRYIYTLIARDRVRGADPDWLRGVYGFAIIPDIVFYLRVSPRQLVERNFQKNIALDYWESGMDLGLERDMFSSFVKYQTLIQKEFKELEKEYSFEVVNGNKTVKSIARDLQTRVAAIIEEE